LRTARFLEPFAMVTAELAYAQPGGPKLTYRFSKFADLADPRSGKVEQAAFG
jgi:hypothetical protein